MAEEDALELAQPRIDGKLSYAVGQRQPSALETSSPMSSLLRSEGDPGESYSRITSHASWDPEEVLSGEAMGTRRKGAASRIPYIGLDSGELSSPLLVVGRELPSDMEYIGNHIEKIASDMEKEFPNQLKKVQVRAKMIYKVPHINRSLDKNAYAPRFVSFGPYHRDSTEALKSANKYKWSFLQQICSMNKEVPLKTYLKEMDGVKQEVKGFYEEDTQMETNDEIKMLLLDGCCILGFLGILPLPKQQVEAQTQKQDKVIVEANPVRKYIPRIIKKLARMAASNGLAVDAREKEIGIAVKGESKRTADSAIITLWHHDSIRHDLLLMENQLPFFVLQKIYDLATTKTTVSQPTLKDKVHRTIKELLDSYPLITNDEDFDHLLHCCHLKFKPDVANSSPSNSQPTDKLEQKWRGATDLYKAGIKFKPKLYKLSESLLDVKLESRKILMIPTLIIEDSTRSLFRNLIAFEQSCTCNNYFAAYAFFMGELMNTPEDVTLLVKEGIVKNYIGANKEVSDFFNNLVKGVIFDVNEKHFLRSTFKDLNSYYNSAGHKYIADLKQNHCSSPWLMISVVAAVIVLVCTVVQTVFAVIG